MDPDSRLLKPPGILCYRRDSLSSFISPLPDASTPQAPFSSHSQAKTSSQAQTIIALGESGSGKSTILKACIKVALDSLQTPKQAQLDDLIVRLTRTLRVADAIGNAQTRNNPDSSRMGKMIEVSSGFSQLACPHVRQWEMLTRNCG